jgi:hypothetical protein
MFINDDDFDLVTVVLYLLNYCIINIYITLIGYYVKAFINKLLTKIIYSTYEMHKLI